MLLSKRCYKKDNVKNGTLKLGTLHEYRHTEIQQIADRKEGTSEFNIAFNGTVEIEKKWFNTLSGGAMHFGPDPAVIFPGNTDAYFKEMNIVSTGTNTITLKNSYATIFRESLNSFIFCMSHVRKMRDSLTILPHYDDSWHLTHAKAHQFGEAIGKELFKKIKTEHRTGNFIVPKEVDIEDLTVHMKHGNVTYTPRELHITNENTLLFNDLMQRLSDTAFIKPPIPFSIEKEYRFQFTLTSNNQVITPTINYLIIDSTNLQHFTI